MNYLQVNVRLTKRGFIVLFIPYLAASTWYYLFSARILGYIQENLGATSHGNWINAFFNFSIVFSILIGSFFVDKVDKLRVIYIWAVVMPITTILLAFTSSPACILVFLFLIGALFGTSLLSYCVYFGSLTNLEERGRVSAIIVFISLLFSPIFLSLSSNFLFVLIAFTSLGFATLILRLWKPSEKAGLTKEGSYTVQNYRKRTFFLYLIPWLIFCVVNGILAEIVTTYLARQFSELVFQVRVLQYLAASLGALVGGVFADWTGRRMILSIGLVSYGIGTALTGLAITSEVCILSAFSSGFSWGVFLVAYTLVVWGDLASMKRRAPFYAAGFIPFYFFTGLGYLVLPKILHIPVIYAALASSIFIFLSNISLVLAPELLPTEKKKKMEFELYTEEVKKILKKWKDRASKEK